MFFGEFGYKLDVKGRVPLPPRFRSALKEGVVLTPGIEKCVTAYTVAEWGKLAAGVMGLMLLALLASPAAPPPPP